eukprot:TRINITY_DN63550_c0_g1_i1.p1 TRINITY_DN63550_c0_g1~~TRINITY_DN63550_c0_g1_i1.p1  ORF type:complete len:677 (+),score=141.18 TRINITY_DN63550_c0_g1_i1:59-2032(+)
MMDFSDESSASQAWSALNAARKKAAKLSNKVQQRATELQQNASQLAQGVIGSGGSESEFSFGVGPLGFTLDGRTVSSVAPEGQAAKNGIKVGDRIVSVAGYTVPLPKSATDTAGEKKSLALLKEWLEDMPRPGSIGFERPSDTDAAVTAAVQQPVANPEVATLASKIPVAVASGVTEDPGTTSAIAGAASSQRNAPIQAVGAVSGGSEVVPSTLEDAQAELASAHVLLAAERQKASELQVDLLLARDQVRSLEGDLEEAQLECHGLRHLAVEQNDEDVGAAHSRLEVQNRQLQEQVTRRRTETEAAKKQVAELTTELAVTRARCDDLSLALSRNEDLALETSEGREKVLEDEVNRLRIALLESESNGRAASKAADETMDAAEKRISELEAAISRSSQELQAVVAKAAIAEEMARREQSVLRDGHAGEMLRLSEEHDQILRASKNHEEYLGRELHKAQTLLAQAIREVATEASAASEALQVGDEEGKESSGDEACIVAVTDELSEQGAEGLSVPLGRSATEPESGIGSSTEDVAALYSRINHLEQRCVGLQKKLKSRPIVCQTFRGDNSSGTTGAGSISWEPQLRATLGPLASSLVVRLYRGPDKMLRRFTARLLDNGSYLWLFYLHIAILYVIASSFFNQGISSAPAPVKVIPQSTR